MSKGYVYILRNPSMPGIVKIGKTTRSVEQRCNELWQTGVPTPFEIVHSVTSPDCHGLEAWIHSILPDLRVSGSREFFRMSEEQAIQQVDSALYEQVESMVEEFLPDHIPMKSGTFLDPSDISYLAHNNGVPEDTIIQALFYLTPEAVQDAVAEWKAAVAARAANAAAKLRLVPQVASQ